MNRKDGLLILWLGGCVVAALFPTLFLGQTFFARDFQNFFQPWWVLTTEMVLRGQPPLWNSYSYTGIPLMANFNSGVWFPLALPFYGGSFIYGLKGFHLLLFFSAGFYAYLLARSRGLAQLPSGCVALSWGLGGFLFARWDLLSLLGTLIWLPAWLLFVNTPLLLALAIAISMLGSYPQGVLWQLLAFFPMLYLLGYPFRRVVVSSLLGWIIAAGLAAVQWVPGIEMIMHSPRYLRGLTVDVASANSLSWKGLLGVLGPTWTQSSALIATGEVSYWAYTFYLGWFATLLCVIGVVSLPGKKRLFILGYLGIVCVVALGATTPLFGLLYRCGLFRIIRYPASWMYVALPTLCFLAGWGAQKLWSQVEPPRRWWLIGGLLIGLSGELVNDALGVRLTGPNNYFSIKGPYEQLLEHSLQGHRMFLSPKAQWVVGMHGRTPLERWWNAFNRLFNLGNLPYHLPSLAGFDVLPPVSIQGYLDRINQGPLDAVVPWLSLASVKIVATPEATPTTLLTPRGQVLWHIFENPWVVPRAFWVDEQGYRDLQERWPVVFKTLHPQPLQRQERSETHVSVLGPVKPGWIVLTDSDDPGWQAFVDGRKTPIRPLQGLFRSVSIPSPGAHRIDFLYHSRSFLLGFVLSLTTLLLLTLAQGGMLKRYHPPFPKGGEGGFALP